MTPTLFQLASLAVLLPAAVYCAAAALKRARRGMAIAALVLALAAAAVTWPGITQRLANLVGIGRGADLVLYLTTLAMIACYFLVLYSHRRLRMQVTELTRALALQQLPPPQ